MAILACACKYGLSKLEKCMVLLLGPSLYC